MIPSVPVSLCPPYQGANLVANARVEGTFSLNIKPGTHLVAGETLMSEGRWYVTVQGRSPLGVPMEASVWQEEWDKLDMLLKPAVALCHAARWLAERLGLDPGATAPRWRFYPPWAGGTGHDRTPMPAMWTLSCEGGALAVFVEASPEGLALSEPLETWHAVPGISLDASRAAEALAAACRAVGAA